MLASSWSLSGVSLDDGQLMQLSIGILWIHLLSFVVHRLREPAGPTMFLDSNSPVASEPALLHIEPSPPVASEELMPTPRRFR